MLKGGGKGFMKHYFSHLRSPYYTKVFSLLVYELVAATQGRILLAAFPDTTTVFAICAVSAFWELGVRMFHLFKLRAEGRELRALGWTEESRRLWSSTVQVANAVS